MARSVTLSRHARMVFSAILMLSWCTGLAFFIMNRWLTVEGEFGPEHHPWQLGILKTHGAAAFLMMVGFGFLLSSHVAVSWPVKRMRPFGLATLTAIVTLILTAYGLYYLTDDGLRTYVGYIHFGVGLCLPLLIASHIFQGRRQRNNRKKDSVSPSRHVWAIRRLMRRDR